MLSDFLSIDSNEFIKMTVLWGTTPYRLVEIYCFGGMCVGFETSESIPSDPTAEDCNFRSVRYLEFIFFMFITILTIFCAKGDRNMMLSKYFESFKERFR